MKGLHCRARYLVLGAGLAFLLPAVAWASEVDALLQRHLEARGGRGEINAVESLRATGKMYRFGLQYDLEVFVRAPRSAEVRYWGENEHVQGVPGAFEARMVFDGHEARLEITPQEDGKPREGRLYPWLELPLRAVADFVGPVLAPHEGDTWQLVGSDELEGGAAWHLGLERADGSREEWWLAMNSLDLVQRRFFFERWGRQAFATVTYTDFVDVEGVRVAKTQLIDSASATIEWSLSAIEVVRPDVP